MTPLEIILAVLLALALFALFALFRERRGVRRFCKRITKSMKAGDRLSLGADAYRSAPSHLRELEHEIFERLFQSEELEARIGRREQLLASVVEGLDDAVLIVDNEFKIQFANHTAVELFGWEKAPLGRRARKVLANSELIDILEGSARSRQPSSNSLRLVNRMLEIDIAPLSTTENDRHSRTRIVLHDVTERDEIEQVRKDFVANASHELRTPLTIINGYVENLLDDDTLENRETSRRFLSVMKKHGDRLSRIIEDMLMISKLESNHADVLQIRPFDLAECARDVVDRLSIMIEERKAKITLDFPTADTPFSGDRFYWDQILFNLVENALKENDRPGLEITIAGRKQGDNWQISVADDGVGIPGADLPFVFKRFFRVDKHHSSEKKGTGLGLSIVKRAVEAHRGTVQVSSTPGRETKFSIDVPHTEPAPEEVDESQ